MAETFGHREFGRMLHGAAEQIRANHERLSRLDAAIGDGDHGTTILRAMDAAANALSKHNGADLKTLLSKVAWEIMSCAGGSTGPLLGSFFMGMSEACAGRKQLDHAGVVAMFEAGLSRLQSQSRAQAGHKTMMDAFLPALAALKTTDPAQSLKAAFALAAAAAASGAEATKTMRAKFGRARNLGDRVIGHIDPGAVSVSLLFKGFSEGL